MWDVFPFTYVSFNIFQQCSVISSTQVFNPLGEIYSKELYSFSYYFNKLLSQSPLWIIHCWHIEHNFLLRELVLQPWDHLFSNYCVLKVLSIFCITVFYQISLQFSSLCLIFSFSSQMSFPEQKYLISMESNVSILYFINCTFGAVGKKSLSQVISVFYIIFFPEDNVVVSYFTFRSVIHLS